MVDSSRSIRPFLRVVIIAAIIGSTLGFSLAPRAVAAAGWNRFIDPSCESNGGYAFPGINWWDYFPASGASAYSKMYYWVGTYYALGYTSSVVSQSGGSGDIRRYAWSNNGYQKWYQGEVLYDTSWAGQGSYSEAFYCP